MCQFLWPRLSATSPALAFTLDRPLSPRTPVDVYSELFYMAEGRWKSLRKMNDSLTSCALLRVYPVLQASRGIYDFGVKSLLARFRLRLPFACNKKGSAKVLF